MSGRLKQAGRNLVLGIADSLVTLPVMRWTWRGQIDHTFAGDLPDYRPADRDAVREMMSGRYLLASKLIETGGASPFTVEPEHLDWWNNLHSFSWLRHFRDVRDPGEKLFARTLVLDWILKEGGFESDSWTLTLTGQRILNWLRYLTLILDGATPDQAKTIHRSIAMQVQSLKMRGALAKDPVEALYAAMGLLGAELSAVGDVPDLAPAVARVDGLLARQIDADGLHLSRSPKIQLALLVELASLKRAAGRHSSGQMSDLANRIDRMHEALDALTLSSGEPAYFNGTGQLPHDILVAIQSITPTQARKSRLVGGYGIMRDGNTVVVCDSGLRPPSGFDGEAHASALAFEFSYGHELVLGNCGPAPSDLSDSRELFRQGIAHSTATIDTEDAFDPRIAGHNTITLDTAEQMMMCTTNSYAGRFGVEIERRMTLLSEGTTLVGQDRIIAHGEPKGRLGIRFHLGPGVDLRYTNGDGMVRLVLPSGRVWSFLWEGAHLMEEDSVRQSATRGFHRTRQLVLESQITANTEVAWIFTLEQP